ncbi:MAG: hypothetical protein ACRDI2_25855, partial [Chloroflexota bacterium]
HEMAGYGHLWRPTLALLLLGVAVCLWRIRVAPYRAVLIAGLAAPFAAAITAISITRVLAFVVPAALLAVIGLDAALSLIRSRRIREIAGGVVFLWLAGGSLQLLHDALTNGPRWDQNYGLYGQQWGATQLFQIIPEYLKADPNTRILLSSTWANGTDLYPRFFVDQASPAARRVVMGNVTDFTDQRRPLTRDMVFVMTQEDLQRARDSGKFAAIEVDRVLPFPDGQPGFSFVRVAYVPNLDAILAAEKEARRALIDGQALLDGETVAIRHSLLDAGSLKDMFDGEGRTLGRFMEANPAIMELHFPRPRRIDRVSLLLAVGNWDVTLRVSAAEGDEARVYRGTIHSPNQDARIELPTGPATAEASFVRVEIRLLDAGESAKIHLRELQFG